MKQFILVGIAVTIIGSLSGYGAVGTIDWATTGQPLEDKDGNLLPGNRDNDRETGFIQLLWLGENGNYNYDGSTLAEIGGDGTLDDHEVIGQSWVGAGNLSFTPSKAGQFKGQEPLPPADDYTSGEDSFAIRVFDTPVYDPEWEVGEMPASVADENWVAGNIPKTGYYNYKIFDSPSKEGVDNDYVLRIDSTLATTYEIPEPSSFILISLAGLILAFRRHYCGA